MNYHFNVGSKPFVPTRKLFHSKPEDLMTVLTSSEIQTEQERRREVLTNKKNVDQFCLEELENECEFITFNDDIECVSLVEI